MKKSFGTQRKDPALKRKILKFCVSGAITASLLLLCLSQLASGYVEATYALGKVISESTNVMLMVVESVDKQKNTIVYKKVRDLKGTHPGDTIKHNIAQAGFAPREWQNVMAWAEPGKTAVFFHNGGAGETCIDNYWYQTPAGGEWWNMSHAEPFFLRTFAGKPDKLAVAIAAMLAGQEVVLPCMVDGDKNAIHMRTAKMQRMKASMKIQDYNAQRDFVDFGSGGDELRPLAGMPGFTHILNLNRVGAGAIGVAPADINNDGRTDVCVFGARQMSVLQNGGNAFDEVRLPIQGGARAVAWADFDGDKKIDLFVASPTGPRLFRNLTEKEAKFEEVTSGLPRQNYSNLTAAAWIDYDGDGKPDLLLADGFRGLRLYRNLGKKVEPPVKSTIGKWFYAGPFDNPDQKGFDIVYPPEKGVDLNAQFTGKSNEKFGWKEGPFTDGQINSLEIFKPELNVNCVAYLYREFTVGSDVECPFSFGSDDTLTVWMNGEKVHSENVYRGCAPDQALLKLKLRAGKNTLLLKICQGGGQFAFYCAPQVPEVTAPSPLLFEDVSDAVGLGERGIGSKIKGDRLIIADVNGDGRPDFLFSGGTGLLVLNTPQGFVEAKNSGISYRTGGVTPVFGDFDGDGHPDLFIPQNGVCKLLRNDGAGHFNDVTPQSGDLSRALGDARAAAWAGFTKKGRQDLLIGCWKGSNRYFHNDGGGKFTDRTEEIGLAHTIYNTSAVCVQDFNKDGVPDVVFNNEGQDPVLLITNPEFFPEPVTPVVQASTPSGATGSGNGSAFASSISGMALLATAGFALLFFVFIRGRASKASVIVLALLASGADAELRAGEAPPKEWPTARGNPQRTGNVDDLNGPKAPNVLWIHKSQDHYVAAPVPCNCGKALYMSVMGTLNTGSFHAMSLIPEAPERVLWSKTVPFIMRPVVSAPAVADGMVVFGDGMHQTDDAILYCLQLETGMPLWRYPVPGKLVHLEASPTIDKGRVYACGGNAGLICVDAKRVILDGKEQDLAAVVPVLKKRWADLVAKYEADKKKDPQLAIPPSEDALPKPTPKLLWQQGKDKWHVDAPPVIAGDFVIATSAFLDEEKLGLRSVICMKVSDGSIVWEAPLELNPWSGPTVSGQTVLVGCSSIRFDRKILAQAKGEVVALDLATGKVKWRKPLAGAVLSSVAVKGDTAIYACTDMTIVARNVETGVRKWTYTGKQPFFGGVAIAGDSVYAADLYAGVHALNFADGVVQWDLDLAANDSVQSKSMVFGSPVVHGGDIYVATCNPDGETVQTSYVVCLSDKPSAIGVKWLPVTVDAQKRSVSIPCKVAPRKLASLKDVYPLEVVATYPTPRGQKAHETVVTYDSKPSEIHRALESIGLKPGKAAVGEGVIGTGAEVKVLLEVPGITGTPRLIPLEKLMVDTRTGKTLPMLTWHFTGSVMRQPDPTKDEKVYGADLTGTLISLLPVTDETVCQLHLSMSDGKPLTLETNKDLLPAVGTEVKLVIQAK